MPRISRWPRWRFALLILVLILPGTPFQIAEAHNRNSLAARAAAEFPLSQPQGPITYSYDAAGQRAGMTMPGNQTVSYAYDTGGNLTGVTDWQGRATTFTSDPDGLRTSMVRPNGVSTALSYDGAGRLGLIEHAQGPTMLERFVYTLDANGNRTAVTSNAGTETYSLDALNRVTAATYPDGGAVSFSYDPTGNRTSRTSGGQTTSYTYDDADQLLSDGSLAYSYDANGNRTAAGADTFAWDWNNRLTGTTVGGTTAAYTYDGDDTRVSKSTGGTTTPYLWDRQAGLPLLVDDGSQRYLHAGGVLAGISSDGSASYPLMDGLGSVRARTNGSGAVTESA
ncbi:MAG: hypothetical protein M3R06_02840, partial [Chloroflexota bacterium]|nr:hypothetical protein [Chloroflexota bacterium]